MRQLPSVLCAVCPAVSVQSSDGGITGTRYLNEMEPDAFRLTVLRRTASGMQFSEDGIVSMRWGEHELPSGGVRWEHEENSILVADPANPDDSRECSLADGNLVAAGALSEAAVKMTFGRKSPYEQARALL